MQLTNEYALIGAGGKGLKKSMMGARTVDDLRALLASAPFEAGAPGANASVSTKDEASILKAICASVLKSKAELIDVTKMATKSWCGSVRPVGLVIMPALEQLVEAGAGEIIRLQVKEPANSSKTVKTRAYFRKLMTKKKLQQMENLAAMNDEGDNITIIDRVLMCSACAGRQANVQLETEMFFKCVVAPTSEHYGQDKNPDQSREIYQMVQLSSCANSAQTRVKNKLV